jgi:hypothetical protein
MVIPDLIRSLSTVTDMDMQPNLWHDPAADWSIMTDYGNNNAAGSTFFTPYNLPQYRLRYFVSAFPNTTETGVLREHVMRLNSTAHCTTISEADFPATCDGPEPFVASYHSQIRTSGYGNFTRSTDTFDINICVPGNKSASPWTLERDRQDISEDLYINVHVGPGSSYAWPYSIGNDNFTVHCTGNSTRGYFELPNWRNEFNVGPLIDKWPDPETLSNEFNVRLCKLV